MMMELEHEYGGDLLDFIFKKVRQIAEKRFLVN
jgi:hypothetical protein